MSNIVIQVERLSKQYRLGTIGGRRLADDFNRWWAKARNKADPALKIGQEHQARLNGQEFKALQDVSFEVNQGEILGVIGRNGAGKSTLLKILSRVTAPTSGEVRVKGRIASLLEVGTGFHPELTGRENIFLNGAILGMTRFEIRRKFDEIVEFSGVNQFIDTPVKRYSSGMYVRLAFAVAAHLETEILIVDEVLAVGDGAFQKKCLGKMQDVASRLGRTVLVVSHNMAAIKALCNSAVIFEKGRLLSYGAVDTLVSQYSLSGSNRSGLINFYPLIAESQPNKRAYFHSVAVLDHTGQTTSIIDVHNGFSIELAYEIPSPLINLEVGIRISTSDGQAVMTSLMSETNTVLYESSRHGVSKATISIPGNFLMPGCYLITVALFSPGHETFDSHEDILRVDIEDTGTVFTKYKNYNALGVVMKKLEWTTV